MPYRSGAAATACWPAWPGSIRWRRCSPGWPSASGGPKRIALTLLAATTISAAVGRLSILQIGLAGMFVVVAGALVWVPALVYLTAGPAGLTCLQEMQETAAAHRREAAFYALLGFGALLVVAGGATSSGYEPARLEVRTRGERPGGGAP